MFWHPRNNMFTFKFIFTKEVEYNSLPLKCELCIAIPSKEKNGKESNFTMKKADKHPLSHFQH